MTTPIWIATPPEVHSALLSSGPGPGPLLAAAAAWNSLSTEYAATAAELAALLGAVQAGAWAGPTAETYLAANAPYHAWLMQASADSAAMAAQQEIAATAYTTALAAMPTLAELAANHVTHAALVATNFFGVNTIPIAVNEADYVRMWVQAATVMSTYQAVAGGAAAAAPDTAPAPTIVKAHATATGTGAPSPPDRTDEVLAWLQQIGYSDFYNNVLQPMINVLVENPYLQSLLGGFDPYLPWVGNPISFFSPFNIAFALGYPMDISQFVVYLSQTFAFIGADLTAAFASGNPATIGFTLVFTGIEAVGTVITDVIALLKSLLEPTLALIPAVLPLLAAPVAVAPAGVLSGLSGLAGLAGLAGVTPVSIPPVVPAPVAALAVPPSPIPAPSPAVAPAPAAAAAAPAPAAPGGPPPPAAPPLAPVDGFSYLVAGLRQDAHRAAGTSARRHKAPEPDRAETPLPAAAAEERHGLRRRSEKTQLLGRGYEYMDLEPEPAVPESDRGVGPVGFTGAVPSAATANPAGLATAAPSVPMMPDGWAR